MPVLVMQRGSPLQEVQSPSGHCLCFALGIQPFNTLVVGQSRDAGREPDKDSC